ncbi:2-dehydro-3-deoxy-6-phosphogalactonate aldolase [Emcibacter sp.]|uniref:2-dehydro-3-deoxy-6-phosphogalactonate aldolase n=1 Tax=Emcibacter sp. TaxID=1979954 RepID=UPI003A954808
MNEQYKTHMFIAGDWGTSQLRLFLCRRDETLALSILDKITGPGVAECRGKLPEVLFPLIEDWVFEYGKLPIMMSGMVGSNIGWVETPYLPCPVDIRDIAKAQVCFVANDHEISIIPGLACVNPLGVPDVMRGEETQVLGWLMADPEHQTGAHLVCLPGTHTKWVLVRDGCIDTFWTSLTGELFALLKTHSVLVADKDSPIREEAFDQGVKAIMSVGTENLLTALFGIRSQQIREGLPKEDATGFLSGHLIGADVLSAASLMEKIEPNLNKVVLIGEPRISQLFSLALGRVGYESEIAHATDIFLGGAEISIFFLMNSRNKMKSRFEQYLAEMPVVAIIRGVTPDEVADIGAALINAGIRLIEVPLNSPDPIESIRRLTEAHGDHCITGAGTVLDPEDVDRVQAVGGTLIVSPNISKAVIERAVQQGLIPMPGFGTASEAFEAYGAGAHYLKLFPASTYGAGHVKAIREVLPKDAHILAVGGAGADNAKEWWDAGAEGFGVGGGLYRPGNSAREVREKAEKLVKVVKGLR